MKNKKEPPARQLMYYVYIRVAVWVALPKLFAK